MMQNLAADRTADYSGIAPDQAVARSCRRRFAKIAAASLLLHGCLVLALLALDQATDPSRASREIPVELVTEPPAPEEGPAAQGAGKQPAAPNQAAQAQSRDPGQNPPIEAHPKPENEALSGPIPVAKPAAPQPSTTVGPRQETGGEYRWPGQTGGSPRFASEPDRFRAVAVPLPSESGGEAVSYNVIVLGLLERAKHYPETARQRGAKGVAVIGFVLDGAGGIASVSMLRSSGEADLDAESVALVNRAAPFPPPPPGAKRTFAIETAFGMGK